MRGKKETVAIRTDASSTIGSGHFMRCLTLADALRKQDVDIHFICRFLPETMQATLKANGHSLHILQQAVSPPDTKLHHAAWLGTSQKEDAESTIQALAGIKPDWLIIDHYGIDAKWQARIRPYTKKIMVIDDLADRRHDCDLLLDQNFRTEYSQRYNGLIPADCKTLFGPNYALLHPDYAELHSQIKPRKTLQNLLIYFGGGDPDGRLCLLSTKAALKILPNIVDIDVLYMGNDPTVCSTLKELSDSNINLNLLKPQKNLTDIIAKADLTIGAIGATSWERLCLGLPTLGISCALNQEEIAKDLDKADLIRLLGNKETITSIILERALKTILQKNSLEEWSQHCMTMCNGQGTKRVIEALKL